jgi:hypothetical protein
MHLVSLIAFLHCAGFKSGDKRASSEKGRWIIWMAKICFDSNFWQAATRPCPFAEWKPTIFLNHVNLKNEIIYLANVFGSLSRGNCFRVGARSFCRDIAVKSVKSVKSESISARVSDYHNKYMSVFLIGRTFEWSMLNRKLQNNLKMKYDHIVPTYIRYLPYHIFT